MIQSRAPRRRTGRHVGLLAVVGALLVTACSGQQAGPSGGGSNIVQGTGEITQVPVDERQPAPDISGETTYGDDLALSDFRGEVVVLNVWGSWCSPCRVEAPTLVKVAEDTADQGVQFLGINTRDLKKSRAQGFDRTYGVKYPSLFDPSGKHILAFPKGSLNPQSIPSTLIIDREGRIAARALKAVTEDELRAALDPVIAEGEK